MYYIFNQQGHLVATSDYEPNVEDLASRGETVVQSKTTFVEPYFDGKQIIERGIAPSMYHTWDGKKWVITPAQQVVKKAEDIAKVRDRINTLRDSKINGGVYVEAVGKWIDTDATAERNLLSVKSTIDLFGDMDIEWTCADNSTLTLNLDKLVLIWQALMAAKTRNHANALRHKAAVEQVENPLEYDYSGGWSKTYTDYLAEEQKNV